MNLFIIILMIIILYFILRITILDKLRNRVFYELLATIIFTPFLVPFILVDNIKTIPNERLYVVIFVVVLIEVVLLFRLYKELKINN